MAKNKKTIQYEKKIHSSLETSHATFDRRNLHGTVVNRSYEEKQRDEESSQISDK